ncbi:MAG TPA: glycosyltransferase [Verrucomicrobiae bacterium]|nr:glycosyltransferase [Verrucomicrobiae bacterium]
MRRRILFLYLTKHSGHYAAAVAIDEMIRRMDGDIETMLLDSFSHANPVLSKVTLQAYLAVLKAAPEIWEFMYDNPEFKERTKKLRETLNRGNSRKLQRLLDEFAPDVVVCTQAFACGVIASWKRATGRRKPALVGVLTDFVAHRYWADPEVDLYVAPSEDTRQNLVAQGVLPERVTTQGIPTNRCFLDSVDRGAVLKKLGLKSDLPKILVMGGSLGLGPMKSVIRKLNKLPQPFDIVVVTGKNEELQEQLARKGPKLRHTTKIFGFVENVNELMDIAEMIITKPGGITTAEALVKKLPMIIINPIPGQEAKNSEYLLSQNVAVEASDANDVMLYVDEFLRNPRKLWAMREAAAALGRPHSAECAAREILKLLMATAAVAA